MECERALVARAAISCEAKKKKLVVTSGNTCLLACGAQLRPRPDSAGAFSFGPRTWIGDPHNLNLPPLRGFLQRRVLQNVAVVHERKPMPD